MSAAGDPAVKTSLSLRWVKKPSYYEEVHKSSKDFLVPDQISIGKVPHRKSTMEPERNLSQDSFQSNGKFTRMVHKESNTISALAQNSSLSIPAKHSKIKNSESNFFPLREIAFKRHPSKQSSVSVTPFEKEFEASSGEQQPSSLFGSTKKETSPKVYLLPMQQEKDTAEISNASYHTFSKGNRPPSPLATKRQSFFTKLGGDSRKQPKNTTEQQPQRPRQDVEPPLEIQSNDHRVAVYIRALQREIFTLRKMVENLSNSINMRDNLIKELNMRITQPEGAALKAAVRLKNNNLQKYKGRPSSLPSSTQKTVGNAHPERQPKQQLEGDKTWDDFLESNFKEPTEKSSQLFEPQNNSKFEDVVFPTKQHTFVRGNTVNSSALGIEMDMTHSNTQPGENHSKSKRPASPKRHAGSLPGVTETNKKSVRVEDLMDYVSQNPKALHIESFELVNLKSYNLAGDPLHQFLTFIREGGVLTTHQFRSVVVSHLPQLRRVLLHITEAYEKKVFGNLRIQSMTNQMLQAASKGFGKFSEDVRRLFIREMGCEDARIFLVASSDPRFYYWNESSQKFDTFLPKVSLDKLKSKPGNTRQTNFEIEGFEHQNINRDTEIERVLGFRIKNCLISKIYLQDDDAGHGSIKFVFGREIVGFLYCFNKIKNDAHRSPGTKFEKELHSAYTALENKEHKVTKNARALFEFTVNTANLTQLVDQSGANSKVFQNKSVAEVKPDRLTEDFTIDDVALAELIATGIGGLVQSSILTMQFQDHLREESDILKLFPTVLQQTTLKTVLLETERLLHTVFNSKRVRVALLHDSDMWFLTEAHHIKQAKKPRWITAPEPSSNSMIESADSDDEEEIIESMIHHRERRYSPSKFAIQKDALMAIQNLEEGVASSDQRVPNKYMKVQMSDRDLKDLSHFELAQVLTIEAGVIGFIARNPANFLSDCLNEEPRFEGDSDIDTCLPALTLPIYDPRRRDPVVLGVIQVELMNLGIKLLKRDRRESTAQSYSNTATKICNKLGIFLASKIDSFPEFQRRMSVTELQLDTSRNGQVDATGTYPNKVTDNTF